MRMLPESIGYVLRTQLSRVVLPLPLCPTMQRIAPSSSTKLTSERACTCLPPGVVNVLLRFETDKYSTTITLPAFVFFPER
jgi:hypothetical protein